MIIQSCTDPTATCVIHLGSFPSAVFTVGERAGVRMPITDELKCPTRFLLVALTREEEFMDDSESRVITSFCDSKAGDV